jgi:hypothetical protein
MDERGIWPGRHDVCAQGLGATGRDSQGRRDQKMDNNRAKGPNDTGMGDL